MTTQSTTTKEALEPCPFNNLGGKHVLETKQDGHRWKPFQWIVICWCGATGPQRSSEQDAITAWNSRVSAPIVAPKQELPSDYICIAPQEQALVINRLRGVGSKEDNRQAELHEKLCLRCQELVAECERREAAPIVAPVVDQRRMQIALRYIKRAANRELPKLPCRVDEMTEREVAIFNVGAAAVGNLQFIARELDALPAPASPVASVEQSETDAENINCPFCGDSGFDLIGLKSHLLRDCERFGQTERTWRP